MYIYLFLFLSLLFLSHLHGILLHDFFWTCGGWRANVTLIHDFSLGFVTHLENMLLTYVIQAQAWNVFMSVDVAF